MITGGAFPVFTIAGTIDFAAKGGTLTATVTGTFNVVTGEFTAETVTGTLCKAGDDD